MRIGVTSDIHFGGAKFRDDQVTKMASAMLGDNLDIVILAGDLGERPVNFHLCLGVFSDFDCPILVLAGNHDIWAYDYPAESSNEIWEVVLPEITAKHGYHWLEGENFYLDEVAVVGSYLHYDYSAADTVGLCAGYSNQFWKVNKHKVNMDGKLMHGLPNDRKFAKELGDGLMARLQDAQSSPGVSQIVVATHVPCLEAQMTRHPYDYRWSVATPYFGNLTHEEEILSCSKVKHVVSGHSHQEEKAVLPNGVHAMVIGADYGAPTYEVISL